MSRVLGGWLLAPMIRKIGMEKFQGMGLRVAREIITTSASSYAQEISLPEMFRPDVMRRWQAEDRRKISGLPEQIDLNKRCPDVLPRPSDPKLLSSGYSPAPEPTAVQPFVRQKLNRVLRLVHRSRTERYIGDAAPK